MLKISVILIVFNRSDLMKKALLSLNNQSILPDEVIVTDDGSKENILEVLKALAPKLKYKIKYVRQENDGFRAAKARNNGARIAENEYIIFFDQDILSTKNYLKTFVDNADKSKFIVSYPVRLTKEQSLLLNDNIIDLSNDNPIIKPSQRLKIKKQYLKDNYSYFLKKIRYSKKGPKLRSGVFAIHRENFIKVNGFDEKYKGWGNEDDDLGNRLYAADIIGYNPFWSEFPIHMFHESNHNGGQRVNKSYYLEQKKLIANGSYKCEYGFDNSFDKDEVEIAEL